MDNIPKRLCYFFKERGITQKKVAEMMNVTPAYINAILTGRRSVGKKNAAVLEELFGINCSWLLTGEGEMIKTATPSTSTSPKISYTAGVPYYNVDFIGGFDLVENDQTMTPAYNIDFKAYDKATCWCNITGHSMEPEINHGDIIALRKIDDFSFLPAGEVYAIVTTNDMRTVKRIGISDNPDNYRLIPTNKSPEYSVQELPKRMIRAVFEVLGCMKKL